MIENNIVTSDGLACDWIYGHLFWSDTGTNSVLMSDFEGKMIATVIRDSKSFLQLSALECSKWSCILRQIPGVAGL